jgi:rhamnosyl/mannosyltransferase
MRVCHLGKYYPPAPGGIETHLQTLARAQRSLGLDVKVLCMNHERVRTQVENDDGVQIQRFAPGATFFKMHVSPALVRAIRDAETDLFHLHVPNPVMILHVFLARPEAPIVVTYHSDIVRQQIRAALFRPIERAVYSRVSRILATSPVYAQGSGFLKSYRERIEVLPMGLDLEPYLTPSAAHRQTTAELTKKYPGPIWLTCGRLTYYKGLLNAVRALKKIPGTLIMVGSGPERDALEAEVSALGLEERVVFAGYLPNYHDIIPYYCAATALLFPSNARSEAFGLVQVEAMASGCPVINTHIPHSGVAWVSPGEQTGLTVPMDNPDALASAARRILDEPALRDKLGNAGRERAKAEFDHRTMARRSLGIYQTVVGHVAQEVMHDHV